MCVYPNPAYETVTADIVPAAETVAFAVAFPDVVPTPAVIVPIPAVTPIETFGATVNPDPPSDITILVIEPPAETTAVAATPVLDVRSRIKTFCLTSTRSSTLLNSGIPHLKQQIHF